MPTVQHTGAEQGDVIGMTHGAYLICCNTIAAFWNLILKLCE